MTEEKKIETGYTDAQVARMREVYIPSDPIAMRTEQVKALAAEFGRKPASVRGRLVRDKIYVAAEYRTKSGKEAVTKGKLVGLIAGYLAVDKDTFDSLEKANKGPLEKIEKALRPVTVTASEDTLPESESEEVLES